MKTYVKNALLNLQKSDKTRVEIQLLSKNDYKNNLLRILYNKFILKIQKKMVPSRLKNVILRTTGLNVGRDACIPHDIYFDPYFPELIYLDKGCIIGGLSILNSHRIKDNTLTIGKVIVKERSLVGGLTTLNPGAVIGKNSIIMFFSEFDENLPSKELWGGKPAKHIMKFSDEIFEKYFKPSNNQSKEYYKEFRKKVKEFRKNPEKMYFKIHYNGNRLNAGDDWFRSRSIFRIFYNGIIIEITRLLPHCLIKTLLLKMAGVKLGKNVHIAKGVVFDHLFCDLVTVEDNVRIDKYAYMDGHEYTISQTVFGKILIKKGVHIKQNSFVRAGTVIGENTIIEANSMAEQEIHANEVWGGNPIKFIKKLD